MSSVDLKEAVCPHDCPDTCRLIVHVDRSSGRAVRISGDPRHPVTRGFLCVKVTNYVDRLYSPDRIRTPLRRRGPKGTNHFEPITWDEAVQSITSAMRQAIDQYGAESILPYSYAGTMGVLGYASMDRRFFHALGASRLDRSICASAGVAGYSYTCGGMIGTDTEDVAKARLIILWGANPVSTNVHLVPFVTEARRNGARVLLIDPRRSASAQIADLYLPIRPATDAALALAMMHVIIRDGLCDAEYVARYTIGFDALAERVHHYTPAMVSPIVGLPANTIEELARDYATTQPAFIRLNYGLQRHAHGGMAVRTVACLPALVGAWRFPGGGAQLSTSGAFDLNKDALERPDLLPDALPRLINMNRLGEALSTADPPVRVLYVYNSNPAVVAPDQQRVLAGLRRDDLFIAVHEQVMTDTTRYADIVLPATSALEHSDLYRAYGHLYLQHHAPAIPPLDQALSNTEVFRRLAQAMELEQPCFRDTDEEMMAQALDTPALRAAGVTWPAIRTAGSLRVVGPTGVYLPFAQGAFPTPSGKCEFYSSQMAADGFDPLPTYEPPAEGPEMTPDLYRRFPINLVAAKAHHFLNSTFAHLPRMQRREGEPTVELNTNDAMARHISSGDMVRVFNDRGSACLRAVVGDAVRPGVAAHVGLWWNGPTWGEPASDVWSGINATTSDRLADMGGGATFFNNLVQVERIIS